MIPPLPQQGSANVTKPFSSAVQTGRSDKTAVLTIMSLMTKNRQKLLQQTSSGLNFATMS